MGPHLRRRVAIAHLIATVPMGLYSTIVIAQKPYERVLMAISWYAVTLTSADVAATTDVRTKEEDD